MANVLTEAATVDCGHGPPAGGGGGPVTLKPNPLVKLTVDKMAVLTEDSLVGQPVNSALCKIVPNTNPLSKQCQNCTGVTSAKATKLTVTVHGTPVLLAPLAGTTNGVVGTDVTPTPQPKLQASNVQAKLTAV
jgi:hypothetical protein